jgi:hypothetical protein
MVDKPTIAKWHNEPVRSDSTFLSASSEQCRCSPLKSKEQDMTITKDTFEGRNESGTGVVSARIKDYFSDQFEGKPSIFVSDGELVALKAIYQKSASTSFTIHLLFDAKIEKGKHFFTEKFPCPFSFSYTEHNHTKGYTSIEDAGSIEVIEFDIDKGLFKATFNFTFNDFVNKNKKHQIHDGHIDVQGLEIIEG